MQKRKYLQVAVILLLNIKIFNQIYAQQPNRNPENYNLRSDKTIEQQQNESIANRERALRDLDITCNNQQPSILTLGKNSTALPETEADKIRLSALRKAREMLQPPVAYFLQYAEFLKNKNTGLVRLYSDRKCDSGKIASVEEIERCADAVPIKGNGSIYSFIFQKQVDFVRKDWWDIRFANTQIIAGNDVVQGIISTLGDTEIEAVNSKSKTAKYLNDYKPKTTFTEIKEQQQILSRGLTVNDFVYTSIAAVKLNQTYLLRSIKYRLKEYPLADGETGFDVLVTFKIIGQEADGSLILLWKKLRTELPRQQLEKN